MIHQWQVCKRKEEQEREDSYRDKSVPRGEATLEM
jgi:hypothetical protein